MASGTILLASNIPVFKEIYGDCAFYFDPGDTLSMSASMEYVLRMDTTKRNLLVEKSRFFIKRYSWSEMAKETLKVYKEVVGEKE
jgi:glycosyltransferase involved in cell wall biosynthesis